MNLKEVKIVADSAADVLSMGDMPFAVAPLKMISKVGEYVDDCNLDVEKMIDDLDKNDDKVTTSCPSEYDWLERFDDKKYVFCVTITSGLSGSCNAALLAKKEYEEKYPDRKVCVVDSLSTGPEMKLILEKLQELILAGEDYQSICEKIAEYQKRTGLCFMLQSLKNLKNNGRVSGFMAKIAGILGLRFIGVASAQGTLEQVAKSRGDNGTLNKILETIKVRGYKGGKIRIGHCRNVSLAQAFKRLLETEYQNLDVEIYPLRGLCSFYAENGGLLVGYES
ncbi:MAG: DegV family EDD domain-containing protein [Clostridiales bacterium]|nr:DegV family EDD domain-containing protein [Clostridiales bacterium]